MKVVVLGGHGFIGSSLVESLSATGHDVVPLSRRDGVDLTEYSHTRNALAEHMPDAVVNCAANVGSLHYVTTYAADVVGDNTQMALNIYRAVADVVPKAHVVNPIANCAYPGAGEVYREQEFWNGEVHHSVYSYGNARRMVYVLARCYNQQHGIRSSNLLVPNTFGPGDHIDPNRTHALNGMIIRMLAAQAAGDTSFEIWGTGAPVREWAYVDDVVEIMQRALTGEHELLEPVNVGQAHGSSIRQTAEAIAQSIGFAGELRFNTSYQDGAPRKIMDDARFRQYFPDFTFTDHAEAIARTVRYYQSVRVLNGAGE